MNEFTQAFCSYLNESHSAYHAAAGLRQRLDEAGYRYLPEREAWTITPGGKYYTARGGAAVIAFRVPEGTPKGFLVSASHTDRPCLKLKENGETESHYTTLRVEGYGGLLAAPWLDRPLSLAGRVMVETEWGAEARLLDIDRDLVLIPNVAIHMNRQANDGYKWNPVMDFNPLVGSRNSAGKLMSLLEQEAGGKVLSYDLCLYVRQKATVWGVDEEFISSQGLDDLQCVYSCFRGFLDAQPGGDIPVFCALNSEEVGSCTPGGADSTFLHDTLTRIGQALGLDARCLLSQSFLVSADNAHAVHPNHPELADPANAPVMGEGIVVKFNSNQRYCTDDAGAALFRQICGQAGVPTQSYYNRPDIRGGWTLGHISVAHVSVPTIDIGLPQLAMHSAYETASVPDTVSLAKAMRRYFSSTLEWHEGSYRLS